MYQRRRSAAPVWGWAQVTGLLLGTLGACTAESSDPPMIVRGEGGSSGESGDTDTGNAGQSTSNAGNSNAGNSSAGSSSGGESGGAGEGGAAGASGESNGGTGGTGGTGAAGTAGAGGSGGMPPSACTQAEPVDGGTPLSMDASVMLDGGDGATPLPPNVTLDNFNDNNIDDWTTYNGTWTVAGGLLSVESAGGGPKALLTKGGTNVDEWPTFYNFVIEADVTLSGVTAGQNAGLIFRVSRASAGTDNLRGYYIGFQPGLDQMQYGRMNNAWQELATGPLTLENDVTYHLEVEVQEQDPCAVQTTVWVDDTEVLSHTDSSPYPKGAIGVRSFNAAATWDNIRVTDLAP